MCVLIDKDCSAYRPAVYSSPGGLNRKTRLQAWFLFWMLVLLAVLFSILGCRTSPPVKQEIDTVNWDGSSESNWLDRTEDRKD